MKTTELKEQFIKLKIKFDWHWARIHTSDKSQQKVHEIAKEMKELQLLLKLVK
tara:strand:+ start:26 stop:184 length:159 start_codon:yes stop_codon:yes gene_type:complete